jgi:hypothetical protein
MATSNTGYYTTNKRGKLVPMKPDCKCKRGVMDCHYLGQKMCGFCYNDICAEPFNAQNFNSYLDCVVIPDLKGKRHAPTKG